MHDTMPDTNGSHEEKATRSYATIAQLTEVNSKITEMSKDMRGMKVTVEGDVQGAARVPGLVDVVGYMRGDMQSIRGDMNGIKKILYGIGIALLGNVGVEILRQLGIVHR